LGKGVTNLSYTAAMLSSRRRHHDEPELQIEDSFQMDGGHKLGSKIWGGSKWHQRKLRWRKRIWIFLYVIKVTEVNFFMMSWMFS